MLVVEHRMTECQSSRNFQFSYGEVCVCVTSGGAFAMILSFGENPFYPLSCDVFTFYFTINDKCFRVLLSTSVQVR